MPTTSRRRRRQRAGDRPGLVRSPSRLWPRRALAALLAAGAVGGSAKLALDRPVPGTVPVLVAPQTVAVGDSLETAGLQLRHLPADVIPEGAVRDPAQVEGRSASAVLTPGEVVTVHDLSVDELLTGQGEDSVVAMFLPVSEPAVLSGVVAGARVDVHSPVDGSVAVGGATVLSVRPGEAGGLWLGVPRPGAAALAAARGADPAGGSLVISLLAPHR